MTASPPPGWYPDPERQGSSRWWDGSAWGAAQEASAPSGDQPSAASADQGGYGAPQGGYANPQGGYGNPQGAYGSPEGYGGPGDSSSRQGGYAPGVYGSQGGYGTSQAGPGAQQNPYGAPNPAPGHPSWSSEQPKSNNTVAFVIIGIVALLFLGAVIWLIVAFANWTTGIPDQAGPTPAEVTPAPTADEDVADAEDDITDDVDGDITEDDADAVAPGDPGTGELIESATITVAEGGETSTEYEFTVTEAGQYAIQVNNTNGGDPRAELLGPDGFWTLNDDGGDGFDSLIVEQLEPGEYTLLVDEYWGEYLEAEIIIERF